MKNKGLLRSAEWSTSNRVFGTGMYAVVTMLFLLLSGVANAQTVNEPPVAPRSILAFPQRDFVHTDGYTGAGDAATIVVIRNGAVLTSAGPIAPVDDGNTGFTIDMNHPGVAGHCWAGTTPLLLPGDQIRADVIKADGTHVIDQTTIQDVTAGRPIQTAADTITVHGTAQADDGGPLPVTNLESRLVAGTKVGGSFAKNGKRTLRAGGPGSDGILTYDPIDPVNNPLGVKWTAIYSGLVPGDVTLALASDSRAMWLGINPATLAGQTIYENAPGVVFHGPSIPPCVAGALGDPVDTTPPTVPSLTASANGRTVSLSWTAAADANGIRYYYVYRDGGASPQLIKAVSAASLAYIDQNAPSGDHSYVVEALDASGNHSGFSAPATVTIGAVVPTIDNKPPSPSKTNQGLTFAFSSTTPGATFLCSFSTGADAYNPCTSPISFGTAAAPLLDGAYTFKVIAQDTSVPPIVSPPTSYALLIDTVAPTVTIDSKPTNPTSNKTPSFAFSTNEPTATLRCALGPITGPPPLAVCNSPFTPAAPLADGSYTFQLQATDAAGNVSAPAVYNFNVSTVVPTVTLGSKPATLGNNATPTFSFSSTATGATFECSLVNSGTALPAFSACNSPFTSAALADGSYDFTVRVTDNAGNTGTLNPAYTFAVDTKAPTVAASPLGGTFNAPQTITLTAVDASATNIFYTLDGTTPTSASTKYTAAFPLTTTPATGTTVKFLAIDGAGNSSAVGSQTYIIDGVAPVVTITPLAKNPTNAASGSIAFSSNKAGSTFTCTFGPTAGATLTNVCTSPFAYGPLAANGNYTLSVTAKDAAGNTGSTSYAFVLDTVAPTVTASPLGGTFATSQSVTLASEAGAQIRYTLGAAGTAAPTATTGTIYSGPIAVNSTATLQYLAVDAAGNASAVASQSYTISVPASGVTISSQPASPTNVASLSYSFALAAGAPAGTTTECMLTGLETAFSACTSPKVYGSAAAPIAAGSYTFQVRSVSSTGTVGTAASATAVTIDRTAPTVSASPLGGTFTTAQSVTLTSEAGAQIRYTLGPAGTAAPTATTGTIYAGAIAVNSTATLQYLAVDAAGNASGAASQTYTISAGTIPTVTISAGPANPTNNASPSFTFLSNTAGATFQCSMSTGVDAYSACTSPKAYTGLASGQYTFKVIATSGTLSSTPTTYTVRIDTVLPTTTVPTKTLLAPNTLTASTIPVRLAWTGADTGAGISRYEMQLSFNAGAFNAVTLSSQTATSATVFMGPGNNQVRVRAVDGAGNVGAWSTTAVFNVGTPSEASTGVTYVGIWTTSALTGAFGGSVKFATAAGATAKLTFSGPSVALATTKGPNRGIAQIFIDGSTTAAATIDLYSATQSVRQMVFARNGLSTTVNHTITIRVTGTKNAASTSTRVDVDGFVVLK